MPTPFSLHTIRSVARAATIGLTVVALLTACEELPSPARATYPDTNSAPVPVAGVSVSDMGSMLLIGTEKEISATVTGANGLALSGRLVTWESNNSAVASIISTGSASARILAKGVGVAVITATVEGVSGSATFSVQANTAGVVNLSIASFSVAEIQYPSAPGRWYYAPLVTVRSPDGSNDADVVGVRITIPDLGAINCAATRRVAAGASVELFREVYGDFELTIHHWDGRRIPPAVASVEVRVREGGNTATLFASATVAPGSFPATYTGGRVDNSWNCG